MENTNGCLGIIEEQKCMIARVSDWDFAEKVAKITCVAVNTYSIETQVLRMQNALYLLLMGVGNEDILNLLESQKEHIAIYLLKQNYKGSSRKVVEEMSERMWRGIDYAE